MKRKKSGKSSLIWGFLFLRWCYFRTNRQTTAMNLRMVGVLGWSLRLLVWEWVGDVPCPPYMPMFVEHDISLVLVCSCYVEDADTTA